MGLQPRSSLCFQINAKDKANQVPLCADISPLVAQCSFSLVPCSHRAATTGSLGFIRLLLESSVPPNKTRLNNADRIGKSRALPLLPSRTELSPTRGGNTPLHLAMDSAHAEAAVALITAGAERDRVSTGT
jgi:26S proteasome non-ATPase regulatory subunit 10